MNKLVLPVIFIWDDVVFPATNKRLNIEDEFNLAACELAIKEYDSKAILLTSRSWENTDVSMENALEIGVICDIDVIENQSSLKKNMMRISVTGKKRVKIQSLEMSDEYGCYLSKFLKVLTRKARYDKHKILLLEFVSRRKDRFNPEISSKVKNFLETIKDSGGDIEAAVDRLIDCLPSSQEGVLQFKKDVLSEPFLFKRIRRVLTLQLGYDVDIVEQEITDLEQQIDQKISKKVNQNVNKQQKEFYLREKMKVIREELGEMSSKEVEARKLREKIKKGHFPKNIASKAKDEIQRFELCSPYSNESTVIRSYLDWLLNLPWLYVSRDETDLRKVKKILDDSHYGLDKVKERIIEFLSVKKRSEKESGTIICFVGPPGVGKTSFAKSVALALNKRFVKISLGGLYDESELRGHRRTYVASMPGKIIREMKKARVKNPVFLLDEIDKMSSGYHGDPVHALLEILDPKQNSNFNDHYIEEDFDLSKVMFIATANYEDNIPDALLDRMEIIRLSSYTELEKFNIAKKHLIPEVLRESGLKFEDLSFSDDAIKYIIQRYTREAGVRSLKQQLEKVARKVVTEWEINEASVNIVGVDEVKKYLGYELFDITVKDDESYAGVVNGMAYTACGGDLLPIEVNHYISGKGNLSLTGNLKDTMQESARVALSYIRAHESEFGLKDKCIDWQNIDVNLHVPSGGVDKDGPSAGIAITTALISSFSGKLVSTKVAMTGEITLRGKVLPVGGIKEKVVSAVRGGVDTIFYPEENTRNLIDIPEDIRNKINLIPVKHYTDVYSKLFSSEKFPA